MKVKENIKTAVLTLLIISSCLLAIKIWAFDSGMIASDSYLYHLVEWTRVGLKYGFNTGQYNSAQEEQNFENSIFSPNQIIINKDGYHYSSPYDVKELDTINQNIRDIIKNSISEDQKSWLDSDDKEFKDALVKNSILIDYGIQFPYDIFSEYVGVLPNQFGQDISFDKVLIYFDYKNTKLNIFYKNTQTQTIKKLQTGLSQKNDQLNSQVWDKIDLFKLCTFSFENKIEKKVPTGDYVVFENDEIITNEIEQINPVSEEKASGSQKLLENLLKVFGFNGSFSKSYDDAEGNKVFVENSATLKVSQDGFIEYRVSNAQRGLNLDGVATSGSLNKISIINITAKLLSKIGSTTIGGGVANVKYSGMEQNQQDKTIRIYFDYIIDGIPLNCKTGGVKGYPITIDINESGQISYAKIYANTFKYTNNKIYNLSYNDVFNILIINSYSKIESLELCYEKSVFSNKVVTKWNYS